MAFNRYMMGVDEGGGGGWSPRPGRSIFPEDGASEGMPLPPRGGDVLQIPQMSKLSLGQSMREWRPPKGSMPMNEYVPPSPPETQEAMPMPPQVAPRRGGWMSGLGASVRANPQFAQAGQQGASGQPVGPFGIRLTPEIIQMLLARIYGSPQLNPGAQLNPGPAVAGRAELIDRGRVA